MSRIREQIISENVRARWGFPDGHVDIIVRVQIPLLNPEVTLRIEPGEIPIVEGIVREAQEWLDKVRRR